MRIAIMAGVLCSAALHAQTIVDPGKLNAVLPTLEADGGSTLQCQVAPLKPALNYGFRFQAGYLVTIPMRQFTGPNHGWSIITRVTPKSGERQPVYLMTSNTLPDVPKTKVELQLGGGYLLGEGKYDVRWVLIDDAGRVCRKTWQIDAHLTHAEQKVKLAMPAETVWELGLRGRRRQPAGSETAPERMTVLLNTSPLFPRRTRMRGSDMMTLMSTLTTLVERVPARFVRVVMFNLDQQKELYRKENFRLRDMSDVAQAMNGIELGTVDLQVLQNRRGHVDLLADLVNREVQAQPASDLVVFLGPMARHFERVPQSVLERPAERAPQFYYFQISPFSRTTAMPGDTIKSAVGRVGGKTIQIHSPGEFAKAIEKLGTAGQAAGRPVQ